VEQGLARVYTLESFARKDRYLLVQQQAMRAGRGIWSGRAPAADTPGSRAPEAAMTMIPGTILSPAVTRATR